MAYLVPVTFHMDTKGCLHISVGHDKGEEEALLAADTTPVYWLLFYCALLLGTYVFLKVFFRQERWMLEQASANKAVEVS